MQNTNISAVSIFNFQERIQLKIDTINQFTSRVPDVRTLGYQMYS